MLKIGGIRGTFLKIPALGIRGFLRKNRNTTKVKQRSLKFVVLFYSRKMIAISHLEK